MASREQRPLVGIERRGTGYRARVSQGRGLPRIERWFPAGTDPREMQAWRELTAAGLLVKRKTRASRGTLEGDINRYLAIVVAMPSYRHRKTELRHWVEAFSTQQRGTITAGQIRAKRDAWMKAGLAASTVNHRLRALSNVFTVLDGRHAPNPVRDVPEVREPDPQPRGLSYEAIALILSKLPERGRAAKGDKRPTFSATKIRLRCLAYCQLTPRQLRQLTPDDLDLAHARLRLPARSKGQGAAVIVTPLLPQAVEAFRDFAAHGLWGEYSHSMLVRSWHRAAKKAGFPNARVYDLRHSWAEMAYQATGSLEAVGQLLQHAHAKTTRRYALGAEADIIARNGQAVVSYLGHEKGATSPQNDEISCNFLIQKKDIAPAKKYARQAHKSSKTGVK